MTTAATITPSDWAATVRNTRQRLGLSRVAYAGHVGANPSSVENWESGVVPLKRFRPAILRMAGLTTLPDTAAPSTTSSAPSAPAPRARQRTGDRLQLFSLFRRVTVSGRTLRRRIAEGVEFANGWVALSWMTTAGVIEPGLGIYPSLDDVVRRHCPDGASDLVLRDV